MKILILGSGGMLGHKLYQQLRSKFEVLGTIRGEFSAIEHIGIFHRSEIIDGVDITDADSLRRVLKIGEPNIVINAVGVIKQVSSPTDLEKIEFINSEFPHILAGLLSEIGSKLIHISTDCVFDGVKGNYSEIDTPNATDIYGKTKYLGEVTGDGCLTLRTSIIGRELLTRHSLLEWVLSNRGKQIKGYTHAIFSGFPTIEFADIIASLITEHPGLTGLYHVASTPISKFELLCLINEHYKAGIVIVPSDELKIDRSLDGAKFNEITGLTPKPWDEMIKRMASDTTTYELWK